ncbi:metal ABC transporter solute-binding protein, Zn/Mn family [Lacticaseibacillus jixiensis]|uniref:metal ABC transporter solute-binding protein, Zn/Mn family n=1 Tax=Lacticaseibacillus jixiensis TaxID=3231926 RepID=UPI0036F1FA33
MLTVILAACNTAKPAAPKSLNVVTSMDFYAEAAQAVLGDHGHATAIINQPNIDPHDYTPTTAVGKLVAKADVIVANGAGYDTWLNKLVKGSGTASTMVSVASVIGVKTGQNEHIWYKPQTMPKLANQLAQTYSKRDPKHKTAYTRNAKAYIASLKPLLTLIDQLKANAHGQSVAVSEPVFNNALQYLGYNISNVHFANAIEEGSDPSAADVRQLQADIANHKLAFFVQNTQVDSKLINNLVKQCRQANIPVLKVTETLPAHQTYTQWMTSQYKALAKIQNAK